MARPLFRQIYEVGDSWSDSGLHFGLSSRLLELAADAGVNTSGLRPIPFPPYAEHYSNGPVFPEITAGLLGAELINFSGGGAQALGVFPFGVIAGFVYPPEVIAAAAASAAGQAILSQNLSLPGQVTDFVAATSADSPSHRSALVSMIGLNDIAVLQSTFDPANPGALLGPALHLAGQIVQANVDLAHTAFGQGIGTVIFDTLPATTFRPSGSLFPSGVQAIGDAAVDAVNQGLKDAARELRDEGNDVRIVDLARMADEVGADPGTFGFLRFDQPVLLGDGHGVVFSDNLLAPPVEQAGFFDREHPTANLHGIFGTFSVASLTSHTIFRGDGNNFITGTSRDDLVLAGAGNDRASLGKGNDILFAGLGNDVADGGSGSDLMAGGAGNDRLSGGKGSDVLAGNAGDDWLDGGAGRDALIDGLGSDRLFGGAGNDWFLTTHPTVLEGSGADTDRFYGGAGFDTLVLLLPDQTALDDFQADVDAHFDPGHAFTFAGIDLTIVGIERILLTTQFGFTDVPLPGGDLGERLQQADLFGLI